MKSKTTPRFWERYHQLPEPVQRLANQCYELWQANPRHASIRFKKLEGHKTLYSARIGAHYRALAHVVGDTAEWFGLALMQNTMTCWGTDGPILSKPRSALAASHF